MTGELLILGILLLILPLLGLAVSVDDDEGRKKPCPFCQSRAISDAADDDTLHFLCQNCGSTGGHVHRNDPDYSHEEVLRRWNKRH